MKIKLRFISVALLPLAMFTNANAATDLPTTPASPPIIYQPNPDSPIGARNPKGPAALKEFDFLIGDWDVTIHWKPKGGQPIVYQAKWHNHWVMDGFAVMQEWRGPYLTGMEFRQYDVKNQQWTGRNLYVNGEWKETSATWINDKMVVNILDAQDQSGKFINRETYFDIKNNSFQMKSDRSYDQGKTWVEGAYFMSVTRTTKQSPTELPIE